MPVLSPSKTLFLKLSAKNINSPPSVGPVLLSALGDGDSVEAVFSALKAASLSGSTKQLELVQVFDSDHCCEITHPLSITGDSLGLGAYFALMLEHFFELEQFDSVVVSGAITEKSDVFFARRVAGITEKISSSMDGLPGRKAVIVPLENAEEIQMSVLSEFTCWAVEGDLLKRCLVPTN